MVYRFDHYSLDTEERVLKRDNDPIALTPKVFETLNVLLQNHERVMSKDELLNAIWPDHTVGEANLTQSISVLRKSLGESGSDKTYIATFSGRGYRFLEPVVVYESSSVQEDTQHLPAVDGASLPSGFHLERGWVGYHVFAYAAVGLLLLLAITASLVREFRSHAVEKSPLVSVPALAPVGAIRTIVRMEGAQYEPTWATDGKQLAFCYASPDGNSSAIYVQNMEEMHPRRITTGTGEYDSPVFSPNGHQLAFLHMQPNLAEILIYDLDTMRTRRLATLLPHQYGLTFRRLDWSPTGQFMVVTDQQTQEDTLSLYMVFLAGGTKVRLTFPGMDMLGDIAPRFSPDGTHVAFIRMKYQYEYDVFVVPVTGGEPSRLTSQSNLLGDIDWINNAVLAYSAQENGSYRLWKTNLLAPQPHPMLASTIATDMPLQFSIQQKTRQIAFSGYRTDLNIWALDLSKGGFSADRWRPIIHTPGQDITPLFSPDNQWIAFRSDVSGQFRIWVSSPDGSKPTQLPTGTLSPTVINWAPDSQSIIFSSSSAPGIYQVSLSGRFPLRRLTDAQMSHPAYSSDKKWIFALMGNFIIRMPATGGKPQVVTNQGGTPIIQSSDGRYLYFGQGRMDTTVSRLDFASGKQDVMITSLIPGYRDAWTITGHDIIFLTEEAGRPVIELHDCATGRNRRISAFPGALPMIATSGFSVSPDGQTLLVVRSDPASANIRAVDYTPPEEGISEGNLSITHKYEAAGVGR